MAIRNYPDQVSPNPAAFAPNVNPKTIETETIDFSTRIQEALTALNDAADTYDSDGGKTAKAILDAKLEHLKLLDAAKRAELRLKDLEQKGTALEIFNASVSKSESSIQKLVELLTKKTQEEVIEQWFGGKVPLHAISNERKADLKLHVRVQNLRRFHITSTFARTASPEEVAKRADVIGRKLLDLKQHIEADSKA